MPGPQTALCSTDSMGVAAVSAIRAIRILEYFEQVRGPLSLKTIATQLDIPSSSTAALLKSLADLDYLSYDAETRTYLPTLRLAALGDWVPERILEDGVLSLARRLNEQTRETIVVTSLNDLYLDYIDFKVGHNNEGEYPAHINLHFPRGVVAATCPFGWCLLRDYKTPRLERIYHRSRIKKLFRADDFCWTAFLERVEAARQSKYLVAAGWPYPNSAVLVTLLPVLPFGRHVALGIGAALDRMRRSLPNLLDLIDAEMAKLPALRDGKARSTDGTTQRVVAVDRISGEVRLPGSDWEQITR